MLATPPPQSCTAGRWYRDTRPAERPRQVDTTRPSALRNTGLPPAILARSPPPRAALCVDEGAIG